MADDIIVSNAGDLDGDAIFCGDLFYRWLVPDRHLRELSGEEEQEEGRDAFSCALFDDIHVLHCCYKYPDFDARLIWVVCTIVSIFLPNWVTYNTTSKIHIHLTYGLTKHCSSFLPS